MVGQVSNFLNQNFYGFLLLLVAALFFWHGNNEAAQAFSYIGSALMGVTRNPGSQTINTGSVETITEHQGSK
jgi:hypothetical protein